MAKKNNMILPVRKRGFKNRSRIQKQGIRGGKYYHPYTRSYGGYRKRNNWRRFSYV